MRSFLVPVAICVAAAFGCTGRGSASDAETATSDRDTAELVAHATMTAEDLGPDESRLTVPGGYIWYKVTGARKGTPLLLIHGGPGVPSFSLKPLEVLGDQRPVVRYDQLGAGKSAHVGDTTVFNIPHFVAELDSLRSHLGYEKVHLLGQSWGAVIAVEYYRAHPDRVASLVLESPLVDVPAWTASARKLIATLPDSDQRAIRTHEADGDFEAQDYQNAIADFVSRYIIIHAIPADQDSAIRTVNDTLYNYMRGAAELTIAGTLANYDAKPILRTVTVPVLFTVGDHDAVDTATVRRLAAITPHARLAVIPNAGHVVAWDNPRDLVAQIRRFLISADSSDSH